MKINELLELVRAGFTKEEIMQFENSGHDTVEPKPAPTPEPEQAPEPAQNPDPVRTPEPEPANPDPMQELTKRITELTQAVQASNRTYAEMGGEIIDPHTEAINTFRTVGGIPTENK